MVIKDSLESLKKNIPYYLNGIFYFLKIKKKIYDREKSLSILDTEIEKNISELIEIVKNGTFLELAYLISVLHVSRSNQAHPEDFGPSEPDYVRLISSFEQETIKYLIQLIEKYGLKNMHYEKESKIPVFNQSLIRAMFYLGNIINSKFESKILISLYGVKVFGPRDRYIKLDLKSLDDEIVKKFSNYYSRLDHENLIKKRDNPGWKDHVDSFRERYSSVSDLFEKEFGVSLDLGTQVITFLIKNILKKLSDSQDKFPSLGNGNIDIRNPLFHVTYGTLCFVKFEDIYKTFGKGVEAFIERLIFKPDSLNEKELRFHQVSLTPLLRIGKAGILVSPELLLDSLATNTHYSLLEGSSNVGEEYKKRDSDRFLDSIAEVAKVGGFELVDKNFDLKEGKKSLGDIDLIFRGKDDTYLLVEAKNHALRLDVYFKSIPATREHLVNLQEKWERMISKRIAHLEKNKKNYYFAKKFVYVAVSKHPEVISHFSKILFFSIDEFGQWVSGGCDSSKGFDSFYEEKLKEDDVACDIDLEILKQYGMAAFSDVEP